MSHNGRGTSDGMDQRNVALAVDYSVPYKPISVRRTRPMYPTAHIPAHDPSNHLVREKHAVAQALERKYRAALMDDGAAVIPRRHVPAERVFEQGGDDGSTRNTDADGSVASEPTDASTTRGRSRRGGFGRCGVGQCMLRASS